MAPPRRLSSGGRGTITGASKTVVANVCAAREEKTDGLYRVQWQLVSVSNPAKAVLPRVMVSWLAGQDNDAEPWVLTADADGGVVYVAGSSVNLRAGFDEGATVPVDYSAVIRGSILEVGAEGPSVATYTSYFAAYAPGVAPSVQSAPAFAQAVEVMSVSDTPDVLVKSVLRDGTTQVGYSRTGSTVGRLAGTVMSDSPVFRLKNGVRQVGLQAISGALTDVYLIFHLGFGVSHTPNLATGPL